MSNLPHKRRHHRRRRTSYLAKTLGLDKWTSRERHRSEHELIIPEVYAGDISPNDMIVHPKKDHTYSEFVRPAWSYNLGSSQSQLCERNFAFSEIFWKVFIVLS